VSPKPVDPKYKIEYVYSVANNGTEFELGGIVEKKIGLDVSAIEQAAAADGSIVTKIMGTYNGVSIKVKIGNNIYIIAVPTLIAGTL